MTTITNRMYFLSMSAVVPCHHFEIHYTHHCHHSSSLSLLSVSRQHHSGNTNSLFRFHHIESQGRSKWVLSQFTTTHTYTHNNYYCYAAISSYVICMRRSLHQITTKFVHRSITDFNATKTNSAHFTCCTITTYHNTTMIPIVTVVINTKISIHFCTEFLNSASRLYSTANNTFKINER